jgi:hypothetical protein
MILPNNQHRHQVMENNSNIITMILFFGSSKEKEKENC